MESKVRRLKALLSISGVKSPNRRILITADLDRPCFDSNIGKLIEIVSPYRIPLTFFSPNEPKGNKGYVELEGLTEFANGKEVTVELGSHSMTHESLIRKGPFEIVSIIRESMELFRKEGIPVYGFRAPCLSMEETYCEVLKNLGGDILSYDSSVLFEGNLFYSRLHDFFPRKRPHRIGNIWELPLSCLDDFLLFNKLKQTDQFVSAYWKRKVDTNLRNHHYFLLLIHPPIITNHTQALEDLLDYCTKKYSQSSFTTCYELVQELGQFSERKKYSKNEDIQIIETTCKNDF